MNTLSAAEILAAGVWQSGLGQVIGGLVIVAVLIGAVWLGFRVRDRESATPKPEEQPHRPETDQLPGEMSEYRRPEVMPQTDGEHRLMPYQLKKSGTETSPDPPSEEKRKWGGISSGGFGSGGTGHGD
ncbi:DUF6479 family protein [Streptomyces sp. NPDC058718]|uniref:DUF6479 family protein n=1 Tax=Streptomyces sp. NPDC058718 TaxID=3346610 RepID=UPI0036B6B4A5